MARVARTLASCATLLATAAAVPVPTEVAAAIVRVADNTTAVPGGATGAFTFFSAPRCSGGTAFFVGSPDSGEGGIFNAALLGTSPPETIGITVKTGPPSWASKLPGAPDGATIFQCSDWAGGPEGMAFVAYPQASEDQSLARLVMSVDGTLSSVVDMRTALPDGGTVAKFDSDAPGVGGKLVAFHAVSSMGADGWWLATPSDAADGAPTISKIVDNSTAMPIAGSPKFHGFDGAMSMASDGSVGAFFANNGLMMTNPNARTGIFSWTKATNALGCVANDNDTAVPTLGDAWHYSGFGGVSVSASGAICFMAEAANDRDPIHVGIWCKGVTSADADGADDDALVAIVDSTVLVPGSPDGEKFQYVDYPSVSPDGSTVVFQGNDQQGRRGVYAVVVGGSVIKLFDWQDTIAGQKVFNIQLNQGSFDGKTVSVFVALSDTNEGIYTIPLATRD
jgi:hypothetical protein